MAFTLTILGSNSAQPTINRFSSGQVITIHDKPMLIDCGEGTQIQLHRYGINIARLHHIFISHLHGDHMFGLFGLLSTLSMHDRTADLHIYAPALLQDILNDHLKYFGEQIEYTIIVHPLNFEDKELILETKDVKVYSFPLEHRVPTCGFLFQEQEPALNVQKEAIKQYHLGLKDIVAIKEGADYITGNNITIPNHQLSYLPYQPRSFAYCSDTVGSTRVAHYVHGVDLLYHEATFCEAKAQAAISWGHSTARQAAMVAKEAKVKQLVIGHFSSRYRDIRPFKEEAETIFTPVELAEDGKVFHVPRQKGCCQE